MLQSGRRKFKGCLKCLLRLKHERISTVFRILVIRQQMVTARKKAVFSTSPKLIQISELKATKHKWRCLRFTSVLLCYIFPEKEKTTPSCFISRASQPRSQRVTAQCCFTLMGFIYIYWIPLRFNSEIKTILEFYEIF